MVIRKVCFVTGTRADYGLLRPLMRKVRQSENLELSVLVTGSHLSEAHGNTVVEIQQDGFKIDWLVPILSDDDSGVGLSRAFGQATKMIAEALDALSPHIVVILGDRYEALAAGVAAMILRIPIAHIHGGETTAGAIDEACRHSLTKMASLHFCSTETYRNRILQLGEQEDRVHCVGAMGIDALAEIALLERDQLVEQLKVKFGPVNFLMTFHPASLEVGKARVHIEEILTAVESFSTAHVFVTFPNAESDSSLVKRALTDFARRNPERVHAFASLGQQRYLSLMKECDVVVGNSSSGLMEAPLLETPTVNVGRRQEGRLRGSSVFDAEPCSASVQAALHRALAYGRSRRHAPFDSPYGLPGAADAITSVLETSDLTGLLIKGFVDRDFLSQEH